MRHLLVPHDGADPLHLCVRLPSSYDRAAARRYPVVYLLPGLLGDDMTRLGDDRFLAILDEFDRAGREAIFVGVDTRSPHGSLYVRAGGPDELGEFLLETFARIDGELRSDARPEGRILLGQSTGGFNVVAFALAHPGVVGGIGASAPDGLDLEAWLLESPTALRPEWFSWMRLEDAVGGVGQMVSYARAWSPGDGRGWPVSLTTGAPNPPVLDAWLAQSPARRAATPEGTAALRALGGRLLVAVADNDEFELYEPARRFCALLEAQGVAHTLKVDHAGHVGVDPRFTDFLDRLLPPAAPSKTRPARKSK